MSLPASIRRSGLLPKKCSLINDHLEISLSRLFLESWEHEERASTPSAISFSDRVFQALLPNHASHSPSRGRILRFPRVRPIFETDGARRFWRRVWAQYLRSG